MPALRHKAPPCQKSTGFCDSMKCVFDAIVTAYGISKFVCVYINWKPCGEQPLFFFTQGINKQEEHAWVGLFYPAGPLPQPGFVCYRRPALDPRRFNGLNTKIDLNNYLFIKKKRSNECLWYGELLVFKIFDACANTIIISGIKELAWPTDLGMSSMVVHLSVRLGYIPQDLSLGQMISFVG